MDIFGENFSQMQAKAAKSRRGGYAARRRARCKYEHSRFIRAPRRFSEELFQQMANAVKAPVIAGKRPHPGAETKTAPRVYCAINECYL